MYKLFEPLVIENLTLSNRIVMPPMALDIASDKGEVTAKLFEHYAQRSAAVLMEGSSGSLDYPRMGIGLVIVEHSYVNLEGRAHPSQLGIYDDSLIPGLKLLVDKIHSLGLPVGIQITHAGARALHSPSGPSAIIRPELVRFGRKAEETEEVPTELSCKEIRGIVSSFAQAAIRAQKAGFDMIEIHGAHGYLLNQFYSPLTNKRKDGYGGSLENRLRLSLEVIEAVKEAAGSNMTLFYRLGVDDRLPGGNTVEDGIETVPFLIEAGVHCLDLSGGIGGYIRKGPEGFFTYLAESIKPVSKVPVLVTGGITNPKTAEEIIAAGKADLVGVGRAMLADPAWARKVYSELEKGTKH